MPHLLYSKGGCAAYMLLRCCDFFSWQVNWRIVQCCQCLCTFTMFRNEGDWALTPSFIHSFLGRWANHDHLTSSLKHIINQTNIYSNCFWCTHVRQQSGSDSWDMTVYCFFCFSLVTAQPGVHCFQEPGSACREDLPHVDTADADRSIKVCTLLQQQCSCNRNSTQLKSYWKWQKPRICLWCRQMLLNFCAAQPLRSKHRRGKARLL